MLKLNKKSFTRACILCFAGFLSLLIVDVYITKSSSDKIHYSTDKLESTPVALVLGTAKYFGRYENPYYRYRINAAAELYHSGKVKGLLLSGDNSRKSYNEPQTMKDDLIKLAVPESAITLDYAGFRTLDSVVRAKKVFKQENIIIVSQKFHCERALFLAKNHGIKAQAFLAEEVLLRKSRIKVRIRELFARNKALFDLIIDKEPKFLGPEEKVNLVFNNTSNQNNF